MTISVVFSDVVDAFEAADRRRIHTLKEINLDAARYRWLRENMDSFLDQTVTDGMSAFCLDNEIDKHLKAENE